MISGLKKPLAFLALLARSSKGNILPMTAAAIFILAGMIGGGVDVSRGYMVKNRLQNACDAGALAGRRAANTSNAWPTDTTDSTNPNTAARIQASTFFNTNFDKTTEGVSSVSFDTASDDDGQTINGSATAVLPTVVMSLFGYKQTTLNVTCTASMGTGNADITFVLDNTASMAWVVGSNTYPGTGQTSRITQLKSAMDTFYDDVSGPAANSNARIRYAFVPYGAVVNVGQVLNDLDSDYIASSYKYNTRRPVISWQAVKTGDTWGPEIDWTPVQSDGGVKGSTSYSSSSSCTSAKPADQTTFSKSGSTYTYSDSDPDHSVYFDGSRGANGQMVTPTGTGQDYVMKTYKCSKSGSKYYIYTTTQTKTQTSFSFKAQDPNFATTTSQTVVDWVYKDFSVDTSTYKTFGTPAKNTDLMIGSLSSTPSKASYVSQTKWPGCILERQTVPSITFTYDADSNAITADDTTLTNTPYDLDIDLAPTSDAATQWAPLWPEVTAWRGGPDATMVAPGKSLPASTGYDYCPVASQALGEVSKTDFYAYVTSLGATQYGTYHDIGLLWGARMSSPTGIWSDLVNDAPSNGAPVSRHLIFMTDGDTEPTFSTYTSYGIETIDQNIGGTALAAPNNDTDLLTARIESRSQAICDAIKARGIRLWVIAIVNTVPDNLTNCASPDSLYKVSTAAGDDTIESAFEKIAKQVGELRITQ